MANFFATRMLLSNKYKIKLKDTEHRNTITATSTMTTTAVLKAEVQNVKKIKRKLEAEHMSSSINIMKLHRTVYVHLKALSSHSNVYEHTRKHLHNKYEDTTADERRRTKQTRTCVRRLYNVQCE